MSGRKLLLMHFHVVIEVRQNCLHFDSNVDAKMVTSRTDYFSRTSSGLEMSCGLSSHAIHSLFCSSSDIISDVR